MVCFFIGRGVAIESVFGCDEPVIAIQVFNNVIDAIHWYPKSGKSWMGIPLEIALLGIVYILTISVCNPKQAFRALHDCCNEIVGDGCCISDILSENSKVVAIIAVESGHSPEPHEALAVLINTVYLVGRETLCDIEPGQLILRLWCLCP